MRLELSLFCLLSAGAVTAEVKDVSKAEAKAPVYGSMVQDYYLQKVRAASEIRKQRLERITTRAEAEAYIEGVRIKLADSFGIMPERTPLNPQITGVLETDKLRIEKVIFFSRPGIPVTGLFYLPKSYRSGKLPGVLALCGHSGNAKAGETYQTVSQNLALKGYAVLMIDPIGQGERRQFVDVKNAKEVDGQPVIEHNMLGKQLLLTGDFFGSWRLWDGIRALDYLLSRPEVDSARIGVTGTSGGGTMTSFICGLDQRPTMAAPSCFITTLRHNVENEIPADAEQVPPRLLANGCDIADFLIAGAPRPVIILAQDNDFFDPRGAVEAFNDVRKIYTLLGIGDKVELHIGEGDHGYKSNHREAAVAFFNKYAQIQSDAKESPDIKIQDIAKTNCTPKGQVHYMPDQRGVFSCIRENATTLGEQRKTITAEKLPSILRKYLGIKDIKEPEYRVLRCSVIAGEPLLVFNRIAVETEPGILAILKSRTGSLFFRIPAADKVCLYIPNLDTEQELAQSNLAVPGVSLYGLDVRGIGESRPLGCDQKEQNFFRPYGADYFYASNAILLNESYLGGKVTDVLSTVKLLKKQGGKQIHLVGRGQGAIVAALAAVLSEDIDRITLYNAPLSWDSMVREQVVKWPLSCMVPGILRDCDLPDIYRALTAKKLAIIEPWDNQMQPIPAEQLKKLAIINGIPETILVNSLSK